MKINYLHLKNFSTIYTAMGRKEITIDFSKCKNKIVLFVGPNGSGKTSILSTLHPFAYSGSMDARSNTNLILDGKNGLKEIEIQDNDVVYTIQHHYKYSKNGYSVKSFIQKDGMELNPNGNVTSFNELIYTELHLELDFLRLLRLGSNVSNLIDMKSTERKKFTSDLLSDINIYTDLFKKISNDNRLLSSMMKTVSDKLIKLNVVNRDLLENEINDMKTELASLSKEKETLQQNIGIINGKITTILPEDLDEVNSELSDLKIKLKDVTRTIERKENELRNFYIILTDPLNDTIDSIKNQCTKLESEINMNENMIRFYKEKLNEYYNKLSDIENREKIYTSETDYNQVMDLYVELSENVRLNEERFNTVPIYTKDNLMTLLGVLKEMNFIANHIYEFSNKSIQTVVSLLRSSVSIQKYVSEETSRIDRELIKLSSEYKEKLNDKTIILFRPSDCINDNCPYFVLYDLITRKTDNNSDLISKLENEKDLLNELIDIDTNISYIFKLVSTNQYLIRKGDISYFKVNTILDNIMSGRMLYDEVVITDLISAAEDYEEFIANKQKIKELKAEIKLMNGNKTTIDELLKEKTNISNDINKTLSEIKRLQTIVKNTNNELNSKNSYLYQLSMYKNLIDRLGFDKDSLNMITNEINNITSKLSKVSDLIDDRKSLVKSLDDVSFRYNKLNNELINKMVVLKEYESLSKEYDILNDKYEEISLIKESLSSTKGIPLLFIQLYLKNTKMYVNELLDIVFDGEFEIDDFEITSSEFNIPYVKNNIRVNDVVYASQGERSFLSLALSFAIMTQSIKDYNILLLDEIDATLDTKNRAMFLNILEKQMDIIDSEQVFLITHNNMFDNYAVDIVSTGNDTVKYTNGNLIEIL